VARPLRRIGGGRAFYCEGHTFAALFLRASAKTAVRHLDAVRSAVEDITLDVSLSGGTQARHPAVVERTVSVTVSAGVADTNAGAADAKQVLEAAERALARAKQGGMNRVSR
jgi:PleD family two-component response regulator